MFHFRLSKALSKRVKFVIQCHIQHQQVAGVTLLTALDVNAPTEDKSEDRKGKHHEEPERAPDQLPKEHAKILSWELNAKVGKEAYYSTWMLRIRIPEQFFEHSYTIPHSLYGKFGEKKENI